MRLTSLIVRSATSLGLGTALCVLVGCNTWWTHQPNNRQTVEPSAFASDYISRQEARQALVENQANVNGQPVTFETDEPSANRIVNVTTADQAKARELAEQGRRTPRQYDNLSVQKIDAKIVGPLADVASQNPQVNEGDQADESTAFERAADAMVRRAMRGKTGRNTQASADQAAESNASGDETSKGDSDTDYLLDAMVGSVNGQAVYASEIFEEIDPQLRALAASQSVPEFRQLSEQLINARLQQMVTDTLIYGEATRDLSARELPGLRRMLADYREQLIREEGEGSQMRAERRLLDERGQTLDQAVQARREELVVRRYMQRKVTPKIVVTRRDIERYYQDNYDQFNPPPKRVVRLIVVDSPELASQVTARLAAGEDFETLAGEELNKYSRDQGGLWGEVEGDEPFGNEKVNAALASLTTGQHTAAITVNNQYWFLFVEKETSEPAITLHEAQTKIDALLRQQQFRYFSEQERLRLMKQGSYNPLDQMSASLVDIAMSRYLGIAD